MSCAQGSQARWYVEPDASPHTFDGSSESYEFSYEDVKVQETIPYTGGIRGTRQEATEQTRAGHYIVGGPIVTSAHPLMLDLWLPRILGAAENANVFDLAESLPTFGVLINRVTQTFEMKDCYINRATLHGESGPENKLQLLELTLDIWGLDYTTGTSAPAASIATTATSADPMRFQDAVLTVNGTARPMKAFWLTIDNHLQRRWTNSRPATAICPRSLSVTLDVVVPYETTNSSLFGLSAAGVTGSLAITNSTVSTTFTFGRLQVPSRSPAVVGKTEIDLRLRAFARKNGSTPAISVTNDSTV